jgi:hypothetical protein
MFVCKLRWRDLTDGHLYQAGDPFPFDGREVPADRIDSLVSGKNRAGIAFISPVKEKVKEILTETPEAPKKAVRSRKKGNQ